MSLFHFVAIASWNKVISNKQNSSNSKKHLVKLKTNAYIHVMCTNTLKKYIFYMLLTVSTPEWLLNVMRNMRYNLHVTRNMRYNSKNIWSWGSVPILLWNMSTASKTNKNKYLSMVFVWSWRKNFSFHSRMFQCHNFAGRLFYSQVDEPS